MKELKEIYKENPEWEERRFKLVKDLCSATVIKESLTKVRGSHVNTIISAADSILERIYPGDDLLTAEQSAKIEAVFGNANGKLGDFNFGKELKSLFPAAKSVEIEKISWDKDEEPNQFRFLVSHLFEKSSALSQCSYAFLVLSYIREENVIDDIKHYLSQLPNAPKCKILHERGGYSSDAFLLTLMM